MSDEGLIKRLICVPARAEVAECSKLSTELREELPALSVEMNRLASKADSVITWLAKSPFANMPVVKIGSKLVSGFFTHFAPILQESLDQLDELPARVKSSVEQLAENGWFFDPAMPLDELLCIGKNFREGEREKAECQLVAYFESAQLEIEDVVISLFPHRDVILAQAFEAHKRATYALSIPVFLAQADGICKEKAGEYIFMKECGKPRTAKYVSKIEENTFDYIFHGPLAKALPISASKNDIVYDCRILNRHTVMHGVSLDYGTKNNSLKAISLLNYVGNILNWQEATDALTCVK